MVTKNPFTFGAPISDENYFNLRKRMIFDYRKWDPQSGDNAALINFPLIMQEDEWDRISRLVEALSKEALEAERELVSRPDLHGILGLPEKMTRLFKRPVQPSAGFARLMRFDFHFTDEGWKISESNTDVPGGFIEASGFSRLMSGICNQTECVEGPAEGLAAAIQEKFKSGCTVALVHATAFTDDRQVMIFVADQLEKTGVKAHLIGPDQILWKEGKAYLNCEWSEGPLDAVIRFFPGEWLPNLPGSADWTNYFINAVTPQSNPGMALFTQTKRFPLIWDSLKTNLPTWRTMLPQTHDPREVDWRRAEEAWVLKPSLGRVGEDIFISGVTLPRDKSAILKDVQKRPQYWVAQRKFHAVPEKQNGETYYPSLGVYSIDGRVAGIYGRVARRPIIDHRAQDIAVLLRASAYELERSVA